MADLLKLKEAMGALDDDAAMAILRELMADGGSQAPKAMAALQDGMNIVGDRFESGEYFVSDLIFAGDLMAAAVELMGPALAGQSGEKVGRMILCTVEGDLHDIGKNIVRSMLEAAGFEVFDLGIDVPPAKIIEKAKAENIGIIGLSGVLTIAIGAMKRTVEAFEEAGLRAGVKIIIGGIPTTESVCELVGADAWALNPQLTVNTCRSWAGR